MLKKRGSVCKEHTSKSSVLYFFVQIKLASFVNPFGVHSARKFSVNTSECSELSEF